MKIVHVYPRLERMHGATKWQLLFTAKLGHKSVIYTVRFHIPMPWFQEEVVIRSPEKRTVAHAVAGLWQHLFGAALWVSMSFPSVPIMVRHFFNMAAKLE